MKHDNRKLDGDLTVRDELEFSGRLNGSIVVARGGSLLLSGDCIGDLTVETGGTAIVDGTIGGDVVNRGVVEIRGAVKGKVASSGATLIRHPGSMIRGTVEQ